MAQQWVSFTPAYRLTLTDPATGIAARLWTLATAQATLATANVTGGAVFTLNDPDWRIWTDLQPSAMNTVFLELQNRHGEWGPAWYGYVDRANQISDPTAGNQTVLTCTSPQKLFDVFTQTPSQAASLSVAYASGISGTAVLQYVVQQVKFPKNKVLITGNPDSGANTWGAVSAANFMDPQQQTWSAVLQGLLADSGLEMFFDERGNLHWRPVGYLLVPTTPRPVDLVDVSHYDVGLGDDGVVTRVEVRYGVTPFHSPPPTVGSKAAASAPYWQAPDSMVSHLGQRILTVVAPWITSNQYGAAHYLAQALGQMYAANVATASIIQAADPLFKVGTVIEVPSLFPHKAASLFYVSAVTYNLTWGGPWLMILGLTYGRAKGQSFPYLLTPTTPVAPTGLQGNFPTNTSIPTINLDNPNAGVSAAGRITTPFTLTADTTVAAGTIAVDPSLGIPLGSVVQLWSSLTAAGKKPIGGSGFYTVVQGPADGTMHLPSTAGYTTGYIVVVTPGSAASGTTTSTGSDTVGASQSAPPASTTPVPNTANLNGTNTANPSTPFLFPLQGYTLAGIDTSGGTWQEFGPTSFPGEPAIYGYPDFHTGIDLHGAPYTPIVAAFSGTITSAPPPSNQEVDAVASDGSYPISSVQSISMNGYGYCVTIRAGDITAQYAHMVDGSCPYTPGSPITAGTPIGQQDSTGYVRGLINGVLTAPSPANPTVGSHLHFGVFDHAKGEWQNPRNYLPKGALPTGFQLP